MRALVVYESMYGNTHAIADHIAAGLRDGAEVQVVPVADASAERVAAVDLLVVGGPTHVHGMTSHRSREEALKAAHQPGHEQPVDPDAEGPGLRDWFDDVHGRPDQRAAAFDTRIDASPALTGRASKGIAKRLRHHGFETVVDPESFLVDKQSHLVDGEADRAEEWARALLAHVASAAAG